MENLYDTAKKEFELEDDNGRSRLVYAYFGLAIYSGQCLEELFSIMLWTDSIFKNRVSTNSEANEKIDSIDNAKKTMGVLVNEVKQIYNLTPQIVDQLANVLEKRNYLAHKYFKIHITKSYSDIGRLEMINYFCEFIDESNVLQQQLQVYYKTYTERLGLTEEILSQWMAENIEQEKLRDSK